MHVTLDRGYLLKSIAIVIAIIGIACAQARAQVVKIDLYADDMGSSCELVDQGTGPRLVYVFLSGNTSATGARFRAPQPSCWLGATWLGDQAIPPGSASIGNSQEDWSIGWAPCMPLPLLIAQIVYLATGAASSCCEYAVEPPPPGSPTNRFVWAACDFAEYPLTVGQEVVINPDASCRCLNPLATQTTTWGRVKSLYR